MYFNLRITALAAIITSGIALATLFYYYTIEKNFASGYQDVITTYNRLQNSHERITYGVLQGSLFAYFNQDPIATDRANMEHSAKVLKTLPLLAKPFYAQHQNDAKILETDIQTYMTLVEEYFMINAAIKNSSVFLTSHGAKSINFFPPSSPTHKHVHRVIDTLTIARKMLDVAYLDTIQQDLKYLRHATYTPKQKAFVDTMMIHVQYSLKHYPKYLEVFYRIINTPLRQEIESKKEAFLDRAHHDTQYIHNVASILFTMIFAAIIAIVSLLMILQRENLNLKVLQNKLQDAYEHDALTRLKNRHSYDTLLPDIPQPGLLLVNIAKFKFFNDFYGTESGDLILKGFAELLETSMERCSKEVHCFRISGDEFAILVEHASKDELSQLAQQINTLLIEARFDVSGIMMQLSANMTISLDTPLLETADMAMKHLKTNPTDNLLIYSDALNVKEQIHSNIEMTQILRSALQEDRIVPYFQPIMDLKTREIVKYEALVRLQTTHGDALIPQHFLQVAQETPLYYQITRIMFSKSMAYFADKPYRFSINLGMHDLEDDTIYHLILGQLATDNETASRLDIELLESSHLSNPDKVIDFIHEVKKYGCRIAIDDFGSGYSNFSYITDFDVDIIKIDGSLIRNITQNDNHYKTVKSIMSLVTELGIESVAEFVLDEESAQLLSQLGVDQAQGFYFGTPQPDITIPQ